MTNKEAIDILSRRSTIPDQKYSYTDINQAIDIAINALMQIEWEHTLWHDAETDPPKTPGLYYGKQDDTNSMFLCNYKDGVWVLSEYPWQRIDIVLWSSFGPFTQ